MKQRKKSTIPHEPVSEELLSMVISYMREGKKFSEIAKILGITREAPSHLLSVAFKRNRLQYLAPPELSAMFRIRRDHPWLDNVRVAHSAIANDVSYHTALLILDLIKRHHVEDRGPEIHIAFAGGALLRETARILARLLRDSDDLHGLKIVLHALVAGFNEDDPTGDPNSFLGYFATDSLNPVSFVNLLAPGIVTPEEAATLR
jgi:hypothetical protein